jgi:asparagine synthase (glutamine-hydrolysing)
MAVSLETRLPYLDHELVELAWRIPLSEKINNGKGKIPLRKILNKYVPQSIMDRPKSGFSLPIKNWLNDPLRDWAESLLDKQKLLEQGVFNYDVVSSAWDNYRSGGSSNHYPVWIVLMFQNWFFQHQKYISL